MVGLIKSKHRSICQFFLVDHLLVIHFNIPEENRILTTSQIVYLSNYIGILCKYTELKLLIFMISHQ